jgi:internalin A
MADDRPKALESIRLIEDQPITGEEGSDLLGLEPFAKVVAGVALGTTGPFTIGVYAGWGQGKTSLLRRAKGLLETEEMRSTHPEVVTVWFDAWQYEREEHPLFALLAAIISALQEKARRRGFFRDLHTCLKSLLAAVRVSAKPFGVGIDIDLGRAVATDEALRNGILRQQTLYPDAFKCLNDTAKHWEGKVIVLIDDLDRCLPANAVKLLEGIKLVLAQPGFVFVLALDNTIVETFLAKRYRDEFGIENPEVAKTYLHKLVQLEFPIPDHRERFLGYIENLLGGSDATRFLLSIKPVLVAATEDTPRNLVRLVNSLVVDHLLWPQEPVGARGEQRWTEVDILTCMVVNQEVRRRLGRTPLKQLVDNQDLCNDLLAGEGLGESGKLVRRLCPNDDLDDRALRDLVHDLRGLEDLLRGPGRVWLETEALRRRVYGFYRERDVVPEAPEDQQAIFERAVRRSLKMEPDAPILPDGLRDLTALDLSEESEFGDVGMRLVAGLPRLQELRLPGTKVSDAGLAHLTGGPGQGAWQPGASQGAWQPTGPANLQLLDLERTNVSDEGAKVLSRLTSLQVLSLTRTTVSDEGVKALGAVTSLQSLWLDETRVSDSGVKALAGLTSLRRLSLDRTRVSDEGVMFVARLTSLAELYLDGCTQVSDKGVEALARLTNLRGLSLSGTQVSDQGARVVGRLTNLARLYLGGCAQVTDEGVKALTDLTSMVSLNLGGTRVTNDGVKALVSLAKLQWLNLDQPRVDDEGVKALAGLASLQELHLSGTQVSDGGLKALASLTSLRELSLSGTRVTDAGVSALQEALPLCRIHR